MKITDGKRTVEINIMTWNGAGCGPDWAQNAALAWAENWRATKAEYFDAAMARRGITCSGAEG